MYAPGIVGIVLGIILLGVTKDSPESAGFPPVEETATKKNDSGRIPLMAQPPACLSGCHISGHMARWQRAWIPSGLLWGGSVKTDSSAWCGQMGQDNTA